MNMNPKSANIRTVPSQCEEQDEAVCSLHPNRVLQAERILYE